MNKPANPRKIDQLVGNPLAYWVAKALGYAFEHYATRATDKGECFCVTHETLPRIGNSVRFPDGSWDEDFPAFSSNWAEGGPVLQREYPHIDYQLLQWFGPRWPAGDGIVADNLLLWTMRAFVASVYGEYVPDE